MISPEDFECDDDEVITTRFKIMLILNDKICLHDFVYIEL